VVATQTYLDKQRENLVSIEAFCKKVIEPLTIEHLNWSPKQGDWTIAQNMAHLSKINGAYLAKSTEKVEEVKENGLIEESPFRSGYLGTFMISLMGPDSSFKLKAAENFLPEKDIYELDIKDTLCNSFNAIAKLIDDIEGLDLNKIKISLPNNSLMRIKLGDVIKVLIDHIWRHLNKIETLTKSADFPN